MVLPFIGAGIVTGLSTVAGLSLGPYIFPSLTKPTSYRLLSEEVDGDIKVPSPDHGLLVKSEYRDALPYLEPWVTEPDYERVAMINRLTATVWPAMTKAILDMVVQGDLYDAVVFPQVKAQVFDKFAFVEDIFLGPHSLRTGKIDLKAHPFVAGKPFDVGNTAPRIGGMRVMNTADDEVLLETSAIWGSAATFDVTAVLRFGRLRLLVPVQLANISFKADVRVILRPLVETFPCLGGVSISLLRTPAVDFSLKLFRGVDIMALPFIPQILQAAFKVVLEPVHLPVLNKPLVPGLGLVLPNAVAFPIMPNFGLPPAPKGALRVAVQRMEDVRGGGDLYVKLEIRRGRFKQTRTVSGSRNPVYDEEYALIVDSFETDVLRIYVYNDDMGWADTLLAEVSVPFVEVVGTKPDPNDPDKEVTEYEEVPFLKATDFYPLKLQLKRIPKKRGALGRVFLRSNTSATAAAAAADADGRTASAGGAAPAAAAAAAAAKPLPEKKSTFARLFSRMKSKKDKEKPAQLASAPSAAGLSEGESVVRLQAPSEARSTLGTSPSMAMRDPLAPVDVAKEDMGTLFIQVQFVPFNPPEYDDVKREREAVKSKDPYLSMFPAPPGRSIGLLGGGGAAGGGDGASTLDYGVLTVQLIRCIDLAPEGAKDLATYVRMMVTNDIKDETQTSSTILNETSPRWGDKYDYVLIPATSELHITVFNKSGSLGKIFASKKAEKDSTMGKVLINVEDVARNGRIKDTWSLQDAERGYIELNLMWQTCHLSADQRLK